MSGLTCSEQNFITKAGAQAYRAQHGFIVVAPDTSPRGYNVQGETDSWDLGTGAGFYVNATQAPWDRHYRMYDYVVDELPQAITFLKAQLQPERFVQTCKAAKHPLTLGLQPHYDHSYYFIASCMGDHFAHHAKALNQT
ncbi:MAG: alpha/beta hydrolase-fold protein [Leptolyngbyaceae cyanobacterium]